MASSQFSGNQGINLSNQEPLPTTTQAEMKNEQQYSQDEHGGFNSFS